jgi:hypothetical protein
MVRKMLMMDFVEVPCLRDKKGRYCYPCVAGMCPYNRTLLDCYNHFDGETRKLFDELVRLRSEVTGG